MKIVSCFIVAMMFAASVCSAAEPSKATRDVPRLLKIGALVNGTETEKGVAEAKGYVKDYPRDETGWIVLGNGLETLNQDAESKQAYEKALAIDPRAFQAISGLGILHRKRREYPQAMQRYKQAIAIDPKHAYTYSSMAALSLKMRDDKQALEYAEKSYKLDPTVPAIAANLALAYHYNGNAKRRDEMAKIAADLGYSNMENLKKIFAGELTIRD